MSAVARFRYTLVAGATAVVIGGGFVVAGLTQDPGVPVNTAAEQALTQAPVEPPAPAPEPTSAAPKTVKPKPATKAPTSKPPTKKPKPTATATKKRAAAVTSGPVVEQVLAHINAARVDEGLEPLSLDTNLSRAAAVHNQLMIDGCGLSHQCKGEDGLGERFSAQNVKWSSAGENIGFGSSGGSNAAMVKAANGLTDNMLAEVPPNDGHRKNLLNKGFERIGLSIVRDNEGITWMTQDFVN
ncbi:CAP domain-containing protein [Actinoplanes solisilvae]|uniref:CAP domain-containing protein n=1 Tax=Actinoplanes solisilvae TaxID=2486853 RepID=UPI001F0CD5B3|nr:CAP domain-containing protein [Actinoplanes solisilvae]